MIYNYKIFENYKRAKKYLSDFEEDGIIGHDNDEFLKDVKVLLKSNPNLIYNFVKYHVEEGIPLEDGDDNYGTSLKGMLNYIKQNKQRVKKLPKKLIDYDKFEDLIDDITKVNDSSLYNKFIKNLYPKFRSELEKYIDSEDTNKEYVDSVINHYNSLDSKMVNLIPPMKHYISNGLSVVDYLNDIMKYTDIKDSDDEIINDINKFNTEIIFNTDNKIVVRSFDVDFILKYGSPKWCIVYAMSSYYDSYVSPLYGYTQYILIDNNELPTSRWYRFGISVSSSGRIKYGGSQDNLNTEVSLNDICERIGCDINIFNSVKYDSDDLLSLPYQSRVKASKKGEYLTEIEKKDLPIKSRLDMKLVEYITDDEYSTLSVGELVNYGIFDRFKDEDFIIDSIDDRLFDFLSRVIGGTDESYNRYSYLVKRFLEVNKNNIKVVSDSFAGILPKRYTSLIPIEECKKIKVKVKLQDYYIIDLFNKGNRDILTDDELYNLNLSFRLSYSKISDNLNLHDYITDDEIYEISIDNIVSSFFIRAINMRRDELNLNQRYHVLSIKSKRFRNTNYFIEDDKNFLEIDDETMKLTPMVDRLSIFGSMPDSEYTDGFFTNFIESDLPSFMGDMDFGYNDGVLTINNYEDYSEGYSVKSSILEEIFGGMFGDENLLYDISKSSDYGTEYLYADNLINDITNYMSISTIDDIKRFLDINGIRYDDENLSEEGVLNDIFGELESQFGSNIIEGYAQSASYIISGIYDESLSTISSILDDIIEVDVDDLENIKLNIPLCNISEWLIDFGIDTTDVNTIKEMIDIIPSIDDIISFHSKPNHIKKIDGYDLYNNLYEIGSKEIYDRIADDCDILDKLEEFSIMDYGLYKDMENNLINLGFVYSNGKYKYISDGNDDITISVNKIDTDLFIYDIDMERNGKHEKGSVRMGNISKYINVDLFDSNQHLLSYDKFKIHR